MTNATTQDLGASKSATDAVGSVTNGTSSVPLSPKAGKVGLNGIQSGYESLQLINGDQEFSEAVGNYMEAKWQLADQGFDYNVCAVFGSQSTGKSTLLNKLFGTNFTTMQENSRQQTTKGIWMSRGVGMNVLVMDVEGTDGRERGEDQDFERKSALFSLATAEVMIVNLWENMVGLYNGANMGLLKTVFEVNLQLFQKKGKEKTLLFFVIRDFIGNTPLENLSKTLTTDLERIWRELSKPEGLEDCAITDFFDCAFTALPHKILMPEKFDANIAELRTRFVNKDLDNYVFKPSYHKRIPADGFPHYASSIWEKIMTNRDLDLPTQQQLLAQYRCDEILNAAYAEFLKGIKPFQRPIESGKVVNELGPEMTQYRDTAIQSFDKNASRYHQEVYQRKREEMLSKCHSTLHILFLGQLKNLHKRATQNFSSILQEQLGTASYDFLTVVTEARQTVLGDFQTGAQAILLSGTEWTFDVETEQLEETLEELASQRRVEEVNKMIATYEKSVRKEIEELVGIHLNAAEPDMWKQMFNNYQEIELAAEKKLTDRAHRFGSSEAEQKDCVKQLRRRSWENLHKKVSDELADNMVLVKLRTRLEDKFRYDDQGLPRVWKPDDDMDSHFQKARDEAFKLIPLYARMDWSESSLDLDAHFADDNEFEYADTLVIYSVSKQQEINTRFRREAEAMYLEAKRSVVTTEAKIPYWMLVLVCALGWNEFLTILTSPTYLILTMTLGFVGYVIWMLNLAGPAEQMARGIAVETARVATSRLSAALQQSNSRPVSSKGESVPMQVMK